MVDAQHVDMEEKEEEEEEEEHKRGKRQELEKGDQRRTSGVL